MARRVCFRSLTLAGFGRYDRATRFELGGQSRTFTSPNELGKSTFVEGLLATLFAPPTVRGKATAFQERNRSWTKPPAFWGELDLTVADEHWRVRRDFDSLDVKVWRVSAAGAADLRYEAQGKPGRKPAEPDGYTRLIEEWLGLADRGLYEAMFTLSQQTTLATGWQIDPRMAPLLYGPSVDHLAGNLQTLYDQFREITRHAREHQIINPHGERSGVREGRLDEVTARTIALEASLAAGHERAATLDRFRAALAESEQLCDELRDGANATAQSLENWRAWLELEAQLRPAVESYERLRQLNERCQQAARPLAERRGRLAGELAILDQAPGDLADRLEYYPLLVEALEEARARHDDAALRSERLGTEQEQLRTALEAEFADLRGRPELADQLEELRLVRDETACERSRLEQLVQQNADSEQRRAATHRALERLAAWREFVPESQDRLAEVRRRIDQLCQADAEYVSARDAIHDGSRWLREQDERIVQLDAGHRQLTDSRQRGRMALAAAVADDRRRIEQSRSRRHQLDEARHDIERRFVDFSGAPVNLPELWDRLHTAEAQQAAAEREIDAARRTQQRLDRRFYWRRGLTVVGVAVFLASLIVARGSLDWFFAGATALLTAALRWIYRTPRVEISEAKRRRGEAESEHERTTRQRDELAAQLGADFLVPPERESEWRRLWPSYQRKVETIAAEGRAVPTEDEIAQIERAAADAEGRLAGYDAETHELVAESERTLANTRAERERRGRELDRLREQATADAERYFAEQPIDPAADRPQAPAGPEADDGEHWRSQPVDQLPAWWNPVVSLAIADRATPPRGVAELVDWCRSLDEARWTLFADSCRELERVQTELAAQAQAPSELDRHIAETRDRLRLLDEQAAAIVAAIRPFGADSELDGLRERCDGCAAIERQIAEREAELGTLPALDALAAELERRRAEHSEATASLAPFLEPFDHDPRRVLAALHQRAELLTEMRQLEAQAAAVLAESGFASLEELAHEAGKAEGLVATVRAGAQQLLEQATELWEAVDAPPELAAQRVAERESQLAADQADLDAAERERAEHAAVIRQMAADPAGDVNAIQAELETLRAEHAQLVAQRDRIVAEFHESSRLKQELQRVERTALEGRITAYFADFSRTPGRHVELDEELRLSIRNEDGTRYSVEQLSHGARDQLCLAVYLATTAGFDLPFLLDDPFVNCDTERLAAIRACWDRLVPNHQLILLSHDPLLAAWAPPLEMREAA